VVRGQGMRLSRKIKEDIAKTVTEAMIAKKRDAAYEMLRKEFTDIAERQFSGVPVDDMRKYSEYIEFIDNLECGKDYPKEFKDNERKSDYKEFDFVPSHRIPLLKSSPCTADAYYIRVCDKYAGEYIMAVRKYMFVYFEAVSKYNVILKSLEYIFTEKQLLDNLPELLEFYVLPENEKKAKKVKEPVMPEESVKQCRKLLEKEIQARK
jgi:hypothetical protein